ncbi:hypothetical protein D6364_19335 [Salmonella enterica subsp. enterica serovar Denver]|nr:hypothetical protein [Salmonella enterica subsp. enterica serovar Denver]
MGGGVVTQAYGQPDNPVSSTQVKWNLAILTAVPFHGLPQPEAHSCKNYPHRSFIWCRTSCWC